ARAGRLRGKLAYMSPEQARSEPLDGRSDLFSLGTIVHEMLTGSNPFVGPTSFETMRRVQAGEYPPPELQRSEEPKALSALLPRLLAKDPDDRFRDAGQLHEQLLGFCYATDDRFGARDLADLLAPLRERPSNSALEVGSAFEEEPTGANERTPVEVPQ